MTRVTRLVCRTEAETVAARERSSSAICKADSRPGTAP